MTGRSVRIVCAAGLALMALAGCGVFDENRERAIDEVSIDGDPVAHGLRVPTDQALVPPQSWDVELPLEPAGIFLEQLELRITGPGLEDGPDDFGFLEEIIFYLEPKDPASSLGRYPVAWVYEPGSVRRVSLETNRALNFVPYILAGFEITSEVKAVVPPSQVTFDGTATLNVDVF